MTVLSPGVAPAVEDKITSRDIFDNPRLVRAVLNHLGKKDILKCLSVNRIVYDIGCGLIYRSITIEESKRLLEQSTVSWHRTSHDHLRLKPGYRD